MRGAAMVVADMTRTSFCDGEGAYSLAQACREAAANGVELRLVIPSADVLRIFAGLGLDAMLRIYPTIDAAFAPGLGVPRGTGQITEHAPSG